MQKALVCTLLVTMSLLGACDRFDNGANPTQISAASANSVAVIDLEQIAQAIGHDKIINQKMQEIHTKTTKQLETLKQQYNQQLQEKQKSLGDKPTPAQRQALINLSTKLQQQYSQALAQAQDIQNRTQISLVGEFRRKIEPIAKQVAQAQGHSIVLIRNDIILVATADADITSRVIDALQKENSPKTSPLNFGQSTPPKSSPGRVPGNPTRTSGNAIPDAPAPPPAPTAP